MNFFIASTQSKKERKGKEINKGKEKKSNFKSNHAESHYTRHPKRKSMSRWIKWCCRITTTTARVNHTHC
jgi:hypothetical protein